jgi:geranylgeranyl pyrophosphate synthase
MCMCRDKPQDRVICLIKNVLRILEEKSVKAFKTAMERLPTESMKDEELRRALEFYKKHWNDVLHPGIIAVACEAVGGSERDSILMQVPMLFFTAAADIHDDIMDESKTKNGKPTVFGKFGEKIALLVGDRMLLKGSEAMCISQKKIATERMDVIVATIDHAFVEASEAHVAEMRFKGKVDLDPKGCFCVLEKKSAILEAHTRVGAVVGNGRKKEIESLTEYGRLLGTLITLRDEFIDLFEPRELSDRLKSSCLPLPMIYAFGNPIVKKRIMEILLQPKISRRDAYTIVDYIFEEPKAKGLKDEMRALSDRALKLTDGLCQEENLRLAVDALSENL